MDERRKYRAILGLKEGFSAAQLKQAYRDLAKVWHPDRFGNDERLAKKATKQLARITAAYQYLKENPVATATPSSAPKPAGGARAKSAPRTKQRADGPASPKSPPHSNSVPPVDGKAIDGIMPLLRRALSADAALSAGRKAIIVGMCLLVTGTVLKWVFKSSSSAYESTPELRVVALAIGSTGIAVLIIGGIVRFSARSRLFRDLRARDLECPSCGVGIVAGAKKHSDVEKYARRIQFRLFKTIESGHCMSCEKPWA